MATKVLGRAVLVPQGDWNQSKQYVNLDVVLYPSANGGDGCAYAALKQNIGIAPGSDNTVWMKISEKGDDVNCVRTYETIQRNLTLTIPIILE